MTAVRELTIALIRSGMDPVTATILIARAGIEMAPPTDQRSAGAKRQAAYRERNKTSPIVTDVTTEPARNEPSLSVTNRHESSHSNADSSLILTSFLDNSKKLSEIESKKERRARPKKQLGPLPENWKPPESAYALAIEHGTTVPYVEAIFRDYLKSSGKLYADHDAAFCNFVRNQRKFNGNSQGKQANGRRTVHDAANDLLAKIHALDEPAPGSLRGGTGEGAVRLLPSR